MTGKSRSEALAISDQPTSEEIALIGSRLHEYNQEQTGSKFEYPGRGESGLAFDLAVKDGDGRVVGGVNVSSVLGVMWLEVLWVAEEHRRKGLAGWLVLEAERIAHEKGCVGAGTWTFSWQGADFYPTIGYTLNGVYDGYPFGITEHVLTKRLPDPIAYCAAADRIARLQGEGFALVAAPTEEEMRGVCRGLHEYCVRHAGEEMNYPGIAVRLVLRDEDGRVVGGLDSYTTIRIMALEALWIDAAYRGRGHGKRLLAEAERTAKEHGCIAVSTHCLSFQSPEFFRKLGYETFGVVDVYIDGHTENLLIKRL